MKLTRWIGLILMLALWGIPSVVMAQGGIITYGETRTEALSAEAPQVLYALNGNAGEVVTVYVIGGTDAFQPSLTVLGPTGQLAFSAGDALSPIPNDARTTVRLPQTGGYSILVGSANAGFGSYTIAVRLTTPGISTQLGAEPVVLNIPPGGQSQTFTIPVSPNANTPITIASSTPNFIYSLQISAPDGRIVLSVDGALPSINVVLPASTEPYMIVVKASNATDSGTLTVSQSGAVPATVPVTTDGSAAAPVATEEVGADGAPPSDQCSVIAGPGGVNIRSGPGTAYGVIGGLAPNAYLVVNGQNNGWYTGPTNFGTGWVAGSVVTLSGPCNNLPLVNAPALPTATSAPVATATTAPTTESTNPTATTQTNNPTPTYTPTATEDAQIAVIDNDHNMTADRDSGGQFTNDVSYPNGDTSDRVRLTISNLTNQTPNNYREMSILVTCFGEGAESLTWGTGGPSSPTAKKCNEALPTQHTNDSNQTYININLPSNGYVTYTIIVTITS
jgi:uncharacterized protein YraI